jgi:hypothetical protein
MGIIKAIKNIVNNKSKQERGPKGGVLIEGMEDDPYLDGNPSHYFPISEKDCLPNPPKKRSD